MYVLILIISGSFDEARNPHEKITYVFLDLNKTNKNLRSRKRSYKP